jgi:hypothetical protein
LVSLMIPPMADVRGIVLDMMPVIGHDGDKEALERSVTMAARLFAICTMAKENPAMERMFVQLFQGMLQVEHTCTIG